MIPMRVHVQDKLFIVAEILNAWTTIDVFVVSILAVLLEIPTFASFIIGNKCDGINSWLTALD
jgi:uncharacterized paraquat-inducible protein A